MFNRISALTERLLRGTSEEAQHPAHTAAQVPAVAPPMYIPMSLTVAPTFRDTTGRRQTVQR